MQFQRQSTSEILKFKVIGEDGHIGTIGSIPQFSLVQFDPIGVPISREEMREITKFMNEKL